MKEYEKPETSNTDQAPSYTQAIRELKEEGLLNDHVFHRKVKYLNNLIESDHGKLKCLIKSMKTAYATIKGFEIMRMFKKGQFNIWIGDLRLTGEIRLIERQFGIYSAP